MRNLTRETVLASKVRAATSFFSRLRGLMFKKSLRAGEGILLVPCRAVHTCFMRFPVDVAFLSREGVVLRVFREARPWRATTVVRGAWAALELSAGTMRDSALQEGDLLRLE